MPPVTVPYRKTSGTARISTGEYTQAQAIDETKKMPGHHVAGSRELSVLDNTNPSVHELLVKGWVVTAETADKNTDGPFERLEDGTERMLAKKKFRNLSNQDPISNELEALPVARRGWRRHRKGSQVFVCIGDILSCVEGLNVNGFKDDENMRGSVVWVPDASKPSIAKAPKVLRVS